MVNASPVSEYWDIDGRRVLVHHVSTCGGVACTLHGPSPHPLVQWDLVWSHQHAQSLMRRCPDHGELHPDPDDVAYHARSGTDVTSNHAGCCGCCREEALEPGEDAQALADELSSIYGTVFTVVAGKAFDRVVELAGKADDLHRTATFVRRATGDVYLGGTGVMPRPEDWRFYSVEAAMNHTMTSLYVWRPQP